ncbi:choline kinase [Barnesiella sp. WM24]|uniref:phosphotransferase n=1 Tax=Barnesiella sp. WM24 TaxID=2558278 RepID=UPI0010729FD2|nr:phosphotransferase [Barnesiella sp. WM24]TFU94455.1 choline kinase [Barnesiella sp. WM24]
MKTAVILAARKERDSEIPYPLQQFAEGICLMDRNLSILKDCGYENIYIVAGFRYDMFHKYHGDGVSVINNNDYEFTASMGSLALCKDFIKDDFLLVESDTFFEKKVVEQVTIVTEGNCLSMTEESGSGDECFVETKHGFVTKITKDRHRVCNFEGEMMGITRISFKTFSRMISAWENSSNPYLNYEYLLMDVTEPLDRPYIRFKNVIWGDVDCREDFKKLQNEVYRKLRRRENPFDEENLRSHLQKIFEDKDISKAEIVKIGGMSNKNFKVTIDGKSYVLRVPGNGSEGMVERTNEEFNALEACKLGVNPEIRYFNPYNGIKLADFIENAETLNAATIQRHDNMRKIAAIYRKVHNSHIRLKNEFNLFQEIEKYDRLLLKAGATMYEGWENVRPRVMTLEGYLNSLGVDLKPCHNDALYENFIKSTDGTVYLIDWEYSGMNDPMADFAALFIEAGFEKENEDYILDKYFEGNIPPEAREKILCYQILWDYLWSQWTVIKEAKGDDFGTYGIDRFNRAISNLKKINLQK